MEGNTAIFHVNLRRSETAARQLHINLKEYKNTIVSTNEPHLSLANVSKIDAVSEYKRALNELQSAVASLKNKKLIICSDTNSRSSLWNDNITNERGNIFEEFCISNNLDIINKKGPITFENQMGTSTIDLIICNPSFYEYKPLVEVLDTESNYTASDHRMLKVELETGILKDTLYKSSTRKYRTDKADWNLFCKNILEFNYLINNVNFKVSNIQEADDITKTLDNYIETVCETSIPLLKHNGNRKPNENDEIKALDKLELNLHRRYNRLKKINKFSAEVILKELTETRKLRTKELHKQRKKCWEEKCNTESISEVQKLHKMCKSSLSRSCPSTILDLNGQPTSNPNETMTKLFEHAFPDKNHPTVQEPFPLKVDQIDNPITPEEVNELIKNLNNNKAPGVDGFTPIIIKRIFPYIITDITHLFNSLIKIQYFPKNGRRALSSSFRNQTYQTKREQ